jgi:nucleoside-diphosphate-sugar epimerase
MTEGEQKRDYLFVEDVIDALVLSLNKNAYEKVFNVCSGQGTKINELAKQAKAILNSKSKIRFGAIPYRKNEIFEMIGDNTFIRNELGFDPKFSIKDFFDNAE